MPTNISVYDAPRARSTLCLITALLGITSVPNQARADDWSSKAYDDARQVITEVITKEMAETAFPHLLDKYPEPLVYFPRTSQQIYRRNLANLSESIRADLGDDVVLLMFLSRGDPNAQLSKKSVARLLADARLGRSVLCYSTSGAHARRRQCSEETDSDVLHATALLEQGAGLVRREVECTVDSFDDDPAAVRIRKAVDAATRCLQGGFRSSNKPLKTEDVELMNICEAGQALSSIGQHDRAGFFQHVSWLETSIIAADRASDAKEFDLESTAAELNELFVSASSGRPVSEVDKALLELLGKWELKDDAAKNAIKSARLAIATAAAGNFEKGEATTIAESFVFSATKELGVVVPEQLGQAFHGTNSSRYQELFNTASAVFTANVSELCSQSHIGADGNPDLCKAGLTFVDRLVGYSIALGNQDNNDAARKAFRDAAVDFIQQSNGGDFSGIQRGLSGWMVLLPQLELRYQISSGYINANSQHARFAAAVPVVGVRMPIHFSDETYTGVNLTLIDALAPFAEITSRPDVFQNGDAAFALWVTPEIDVQFGMPWLSPRLVVDAGVSLRPVLPTKLAQPADPQRPYEYRSIFNLDSDHHAYDALQFSMGIRYIP